MRKLLLVLGGLFCAVSATMAGPNAGGVLWVHDMGVIDSQTPPSPKPSNCAAVDNNAVVYTALPGNPWNQTWKVYAAFPGGSSPRLKYAAWRTEFSEAAGSPHSFVHITSAACKVPDEDGAGTDFFIADLGFPTASGGQVGQSFPTGPRTSLVTALFIFGGYGYNAGGTQAPPIWATVEHSDPANRFFGDDAVPVHLDPIMGYSTLGFGAPGNTVCPVLPTGACCNTATGACTITTQALCTFTWLGVDTVCNAQTCPVPTGSCCAYSGVCTVTIQADCVGLSVWTAGGNCTPNPCSGPGVGACCASDGTCTITLPDNCTGTWTAYGTCTPNICPQPYGACCAANGECTVTIQTACTGTWTMFGTCDPNPCPPPTGSCCEYSGLCTVTIQADCIAPSFWTEGGTCTPYGCYHPGTGACCASDGTCTIRLQSDCTGTWIQYGSCEPNVCLQPVGSCCAANGDCTVTLQPACNGTWTMFETCEPNLCPQPTGACCDDATGACTITTQADCGFAWLGAGVPCNVETCPPPPSEGACCFATGECMITTQADCAGTYWIEGGLCSPNSCDQPPPVVGACCDVATGGCTITTEAACPFHWLGEGAPCNLANCPVPIPVERTSWGQIKNIYR